MLGIDDFWIACAYILCFLSAVACVVYGAINWNKNDEPPVTPEDAAWETEEQDVDEAL